MGFCGCWEKSKAPAVTCWLEPATHWMHQPMSRWITTLRPKLKSRNPENLPVEIQGREMFVTCWTAVCVYMYIYICIYTYCFLFINLFIISLTSSLGWLHASGQICGSIGTLRLPYPRCRASPQSFRKAKRDGRSGRPGWGSRWQGWRFLDSLSPGIQRFLSFQKPKIVSHFHYFRCFLF